VRVVAATEASAVPLPGRGVAAPRGRFLTRRDSSSASGIAQSGAGEIAHAAGFGPEKDLAPGADVFALANHTVDARENPLMCSHFEKWRGPELNRGHHDVSQSRAGR
jgi:hypothetical protein